jgi:drug/metabolite transporter (DMT)-like permease
MPSVEPIPTTRKPGHLVAVLQALLVTFLWSTSWVLIKIGLVELPPLVFAGLRYLLAALILLAFLLHDRDSRQRLRELTKRDWLLLGSLGVVMYTLTQGAQFVALGEIPAVMLNLVLSFTPVFVALLSTHTLREPLTGLQWLGVIVLVAGATLYLGFSWPAKEHLFGLGVAFAGMVANGGAALLGRYVNRSQRFRPLTVTAVSMTLGAVVLFTAGLAIEGMPRLDLEHWLIVAWLAVVNTAFAFTLWNHTLGRLTATESSVINNTMLIQIAILAWVFLGESLSGRQIAGVLVAAIGALLVQLRWRRAAPDRERVIS